MGGGVGGEGGWRAAPLAAVILVLAVTVHLKAASLGLSSGVVHAHTGERTNARMNTEPIHG